MGKKLRAICAFGLAIALAFPAYAAVQNVKVSGDMTVRSFVRQNYDLDRDANFSNTTTAGVTPDTNPGNNATAYFMHSVGVNVLADLTDNVGTTLRITNQRDWDNNSSGANTFDADIDLAYVSLKEFFYAPLTVNVGRQDLWYGKGFIVGAKLLDHNLSINANEYTETGAFDAIKATIDWNPWIIDLAYAKVDENVVSSRNDDVNLYVINVGHKQDWNNAESEVYFVSKIDRGPQIQNYPLDAAESTELGENSVYTLGLRGSMDIPENILGNILAETTVAGELAHQSGKYRQVRGQERDRDAWALDVSGEKKFSNVTWKPKLGLEYILYSGENTYADIDTGDWQAWDPVFRGKFDTAIREFQNYYYPTRFRAASVGTTEVDMDSGLTNEKQLILSGTIYPIKKLTAKGAVTQFWLDTPLKDDAGMQRSTNLGQELDLQLTYDYSSDVSFNLLAGYFFPGKYWMADQNDVARDIVGSVKLTF